MPPIRRERREKKPSPLSRIKIKAPSTPPDVKQELEFGPNGEVKQERVPTPLPQWPSWSVPNDYEPPKPEPRIRPTHSEKSGRRLIARAVRRIRRKKIPKVRQVPLPPYIDDPAKRKLDVKLRPADRRTVYPDSDMSYDENDPEVVLLESRNPWQPIRYKKFPKVQKRYTAVGVNTSHLKHYNKVFTRHPESGERIEHAVHRLKICSEHMIDFLYVKEYVKKFKDMDKKVWSLLEAQKIHSREYLNELVNLADHMDFSVQTWCSQFDSVQMTKETADVCVESLFLCLFMASAIYEGMYFNGFALVRPPGHHAQYDCPAGFCVINNVAATAAYLLRKPNVHKVLIIDVDVHHGNGTQELFYDRDDVTYISIHRYENGRFWPYKRESDYDNIGEGRGKGHNMNICINENGGHDVDYMFIFTELILPVARELNPDYIIFSSGYDACYGDPIGVMDIEADVFSHMIYHLNPVCNGKILCVLEGGYNHSSVAVGVDNNVRVLSGMKPHVLNSHTKEPARKSTAHSVYDLICVLRPYWPVLWSYYTFLPSYVPKYKQKKPAYTQDQHIVTGDVAQKRLFDCYEDVEVTHAIRPEYQVFMPKVRFHPEEIPDAKYYYLFGIEDVRHTTLDHNQNFVGYVYHFSDIELKLTTNSLFRIYEDHFDNGPPPKRKTKKFRPEPDKPGEFPWYHLIYESIHLATRNDTNSRCLIVTWGFHRQVKVKTSRQMQINIGMGEGDARTPLYLPINFMQEPTVDGLLYLIVKLLPVFYHAEAQFVYLCLDKNVPAVFNDPEVLRVLLWTLQGVDNRRFTVYYNGTDLTGDITAYTCDPYYRKDESEIALPKRRLQLDGTWMKDIVHSFWVPNPERRPAYQSRIMIPIPRVEKNLPMFRPPPHASLPSVGRRHRLAEGLTESTECDFSVKRTVFNVDEATSRKFLPPPIEYTEGDSLEEYTTVTYVSDDGEEEPKEAKNPRIVLRIPKKEPVPPSSSDSSSDNDTVQRPNIGGTGSSNPPTDDEAEANGDSEDVPPPPPVEANDHSGQPNGFANDINPVYEEVDQSYDADDDGFDQNDDGDVGISGDEDESTGKHHIGNAIPDDISSSSSSDDSSSSSSDSDSSDSDSSDSDSSDSSNNDVNTNGQPKYNYNVLPMNRKRKASHFSSSSSSSSSSSASSDSDNDQIPSLAGAPNPNSLADIILSTDSSDYEVNQD